MAGTTHGAALDADLAAWIGRRSERQDVMDERLIAEFTATLSPYLARMAKVPPGLFWCLAPDIAPMGQLGGDGHPRLGLFLPDPALPRRMWAGGELVFHGDFSPGDRVTKTSIIEDISFKVGKSGRLCFVTQRHRYGTRGQLVLEERQDIVYREPPAAAAGAGTAAAAGQAAAGPGDWVVTPVPPLLFRYSAMTFNGHRIHYDFPYATEVEGYAGLVVHGPLQATLMLNLAAERLGRLPRRFAYRGLAPLICDRPFAVTATAGPEGGLETRVVAAAGETTMAGRAA
jgi:3-methylfumaryl-CoA hydratase